LSVLVDQDSRQWGAYIIGNRNPTEYLQGIESLKTDDPELYFAVTVLWKVVSSWVYNLEEYG